MQEKKAQGTGVKFRHPHTNIWHRVVISYIPSTQDALNITKFHFTNWIHSQGSRYKCKCGLNFHLSKSLKTHQANGYPYNERN